MLRCLLRTDRDTVDLIQRDVNDCGEASRTPFLILALFWQKQCFDLRIALRWMGEYMF